MSSEIVFIDGQIVESISFYEWQAWSKMQFWGDLLPFCLPKVRWFFLEKSDYTRKCVTLCMCEFFWWYEIVLWFIPFAREASRLPCSLCFFQKDLCSVFIEKCCEMPSLRKTDQLLFRLKGFLGGWSISNIKKSHLF